jgi:hypothetical protein
MVEFMGAGMVEVFSFHIELDAITDAIGKALQVGDGGGAALEFFADAAQFINELSGFTDGEIGIVDLSHCLFQIIVDIGAAIGAEITFLIGIVLKISIEIDVVEFHDKFLQIYIM